MDCIIFIDEPYQMIPGNKKIVEVIRNYDRIVKQGEKLRMVYGQGSSSGKMRFLSLLASTLSPAESDKYLFVNPEAG